ncbi:hypothetical protein [Streptomyces sp. NPDC050263]|uniref:hypothetical protein n=1 Tax=Streptomyces sp. NPDC050263 TaxID=3155037 RepID=UPI00342545F7
MYGALVGTMVVCVTVMAALGIAAVTREWMPPLRRRSVLRPRLWGIGALMSALGLSLFVFLGPLAPGGPAVNFFIPLVGMAVNLAGLGVQSLARRPGRTPPLPPTTTTTAS